MRKYRRFKGPHQPSVASICAERASLNDKATNISLLLKTLVKKCHCGGPARVKVSVDGHDPSRNLHAVTFSISLVCEPTPQSSRHIVPIITLSGTEEYDFIRQSGAWDLIQAQLSPIVDIDGKQVHVEYFLCADLKSLLLCLGYKSANARDVCLFCSCDKNRWGSCCEDGKCALRYREASDGTLTLPTLLPSDAGYKQPPLVDMSKYKFVIIDILHLYLRVTDQIFVRSCNFIAKRQLAEFFNICRSQQICSFNIRDENGSLRFSNLDKAKREILIERVFGVRGVLHTVMPPIRADIVLAAVNAFAKMWKQIDASDPDVDLLRLSVVTFTKQFRKSFASDEVPNYVHMLCHLPMLVRHFGQLRVFQQQRVEALNNTINQKVRTVTRPGPSQMTQALQAVNRCAVYE